MNYEYEELRKLGLPEIPDGYQLRFNMKRKATSGYQTFYNVLYVSVYKTFFGIPLPWKGAFLSQTERANRWCSDIDFLLENGYLTEEQFLSQKWYPAHLAAAGRYAYNELIALDLRKKQRKNDLKARRKAEKQAEVDDLAEIKSFLGKGMP